MSRAQRVVFLPLNANREVDGVQCDVADNGRLDELLKKGWHIIQITSAGDRGGVYAVIEREAPPAGRTIPVPGT